MKKAFLSLLLLMIGFVGAKAQKFALIDMEYLLKNIPAYQTANNQIDSYAKSWQSEIDKAQQEAKNMYADYQTNLSRLSVSQKNTKENQIVAKEQEIENLKKKYFGNEGEMMKKREQLIKPIQDKIYTVVKEISEEKGYSMVIDRASAMSIIFASPLIDISKEVLSRLQY